MKSFKGYLEEEWEFPIITLSHDLKHETFASKNLFDADIRAQINVELLKGTSYLYVNPHGALNRVSEILARYGVIVPKAYWPSIDGGSLIWKIDQNGSLSGYAPPAGSEAAEHQTEQLYLYFEYQVNELGRYLIYCEVVNNSDLDDLLKDEPEEE